MTAARLIVWRHGRTEWNHTGRFQGQADVPLDERGILQAKTAAPALARLHPSRIIASDLSRAQQTAAPLAELTGLTVSTDARLREIHVGTWEGLTADEVAAADPDRAHRYFQGEDIRRSATGETVAEVSARVSEVLTEVAAEADDGTTAVVVMHGLAARVGVCRFVGFPQETWRLLGGMHNCGWISLERHRTGDYWRIDEYNVTVSLDVQDPIS
ncbi:MAG: histidine phosphatase family protein [Propionibacteriaceae bacterium]